MKSKDDHYTEEETAKRRDDAIRRAMNTPPLSRKKAIGKVKDRGRAKTGKA